MKILRWIKENKIVATIIGTVIADLISSLVLSFIKKINIIEATTVIWKTLFGFILNILKYKISIWIILIVVATLIMIRIFVLRFFGKKNYSINTDKKYKEYYEDKYGGRTYSWDYEEYGNTIDITDFRIICPTCKGNLIEKYQYQNTFYGMGKQFCPNCQKIVCDTPSIEELREADVFIKNNINKILKAGD